MANRGINKAIVVGNVGQEPETRYMPNGDAVTNLTLATSESWKDKNTGQQQERTEWHRVTFYRRLAEIVSEYVHKGSKLYIEGRLQTRSWEQDGVKRYTTEIIANEMQMLDSRGSNSAPQQEGGYQSSAAPSSNAQSSNAQSSNASRTATAPQQAPAGMDSFDDDIPF